MAPTVLSTPTMPPIVPMAVSSSQNTVSPVRFHTPNASPSNNPDKDDGDESDKLSARDSENEDNTNEKNNHPAAGGGNVKQTNNKNSGNPGGDPDDSDDEPHHGDNNRGSDSDNETDNNIEVVDDIFSPSIQNQLANHLKKPSDKIDSFHDDSSSRSIMQVKSIEMAFTKLDKASIEDFKFKTQITCRDLKHLNPAIWISKTILNVSLKQANKDITDASKSSSRQPRYFKYSRMTAEELYTKIGERSPIGELIGVIYIVKVMTRCIVDTKHLFENCLQEFQSIECREISISLIRGMQSKVAQIFDH